MPWAIDASGILCRMRSRYEGHDGWTVRGRRRRWMNDWGACGVCVRCGARLMMLRVICVTYKLNLCVSLCIIELKEIWCAFIERKMECRRSPAGHGSSPLSLPLCIVHWWRLARRAAARWQWVRAGAKRRRARRGSRRRVALRCAPCCERDVTRAVRIVRNSKACFLMVAVPKMGARAPTHMTKEQLKDIVRSNSRVRGCSPPSTEANDGTVGKLSVTRVRPC